MKDVFKIIVTFLYDEELDLEVRTASLYTLYAFYCHQLSKFKLKVWEVFYSTGDYSKFKEFLIHKDSNIALSVDIYSSIYWHNIKMWTCWRGVCV
jgi:hypothetical protein